MDRIDKARGCIHWKGHHNLHEKSAPIEVRTPTTSGKAYNGNAAWLSSVIDSYPKLPPITCIPQLPVITVFGEVPHHILGNSARITFQLFLISYVLDAYLAAIHPLFIHISYSIQWHQK